MRSRECMAARWAVRAGSACRRWFPSTSVQQTKMNRTLAIVALVLSVAAGWAQNTASLRGTVTDPSGAAVPGAVVQLRGQGGEHRVKTGTSGQYAFPSLATVTYQIRVTSKGVVAVT